MVSCGHYHTALLRGGGRAVAFGHNEFGQSCIRQPTRHGRDDPTAVRYVGIAAGGHSTVLLRSDGLAIAIGRDDEDQCDVPDLPEYVTYVRAAVGYKHTVLVRSDGVAVAFGYNGNGQCNVPSELPSGVGYVGAAAGLYHTVLLRSDGAAIAFGNDADGRCDVPVLPDGVRYVDAAAGDQHTVLVRSDGQVAAFGHDEDGSCTVPALPVGVGYVRAAVGRSHTVLLRSDGQVVAVGENDDDQCNVPELPPGVGYVGVAAGSYHTVLVRSDGQACAMGRDDFQQCSGLPPYDADATYVASPPATVEFSAVTNGQSFSGVVAEVTTPRKTNASLEVATLEGIEDPRSPSATSEAPSSLVGSPTSNSREYIVSISRGAGKLGMRIEVHKKPGRLKVVGVDSGVVQEWNEANPGSEVMVDDYIMEANGIRGDGKLMKEQLKIAENLVLVLARSSQRPIE
eukprot:TRINITY_DN22175_c0_g1_i1.p1 TRINITY_DN22175_c0_g1~~TRINITY_DN22175_c0_g1_i1.p1  ORF type:complete len:455 (-),score=85.72 TRINITY_DN22175_c0_g1_i1:94-1458(-)